ncbi:type IV pilus biogenesis protein PilM [Camelliibacillus cellulosilyticus]|uniref:Type IV pilus biogenesis protein PilM n=1 Tax=Camelliibacillus cellulosilyticus TaxID=2174486 RepID=A0ABV9GQ75_9BACL
MAFIRNKTCVSLDIQDHVIRFVDAKEPDIHAIQAFGERSLPSGIIEKGKILDREALRKIVKACAKEWKIRRRHIQFHVPDAFVFLRKVELPDQVAEEEIQSFLFMEVGTSIPLPFEDPVFDYMVLPANKAGHREILLIASSKPIVEEYHDILASAGLKPEKADISPLSVYRLLHALGLTNPEDHLMCVELYSSMMTVSVYYEHKPYFIRQLQGAAGADSFAEIDRIANFYRYSLNAGDARISKIMLIGDRPHLKNLEESLAGSLDIAVETLEDYKIQTLSGKKMPQSFYLTLGLALKGGS